MLLLSLTGWPGIGIDKLIPHEFTPGKIALRLFAAVSALAFPPSRQSSKWNKDCLTGFE